MIQSHGLKTNNGGDLNTDEYEIESLLPTLNTTKKHARWVPTATAKDKRRVPIQNVIKSRLGTGRLPSIGSVIATAATASIAFKSILPFAVGGTAVVALGVSANAVNSAANHIENVDHTIDETLTTLNTVLQPQGNSDKSDITLVLEAVTPGFLAVSALTKSIEDKQLIEKITSVDTVALSSLIDKLAKSDLDLLFKTVNSIAKNLDTVTVHQDLTFDTNSKSKNGLETSQQTGQETENGTTSVVGLA